MFDQKNFKIKKMCPNFLILIIARSSADASADESSDNFLKKICFSLIFSLF